MFDFTSLTECILFYSDERNFLSVVEQRGSEIKEVSLREKNGDNYVKFGTKASNTLKNIMLVRYKEHGLND